MKLYCGLSLLFSSPLFSSPLLSSPLLSSPLPSSSLYIPLIKGGENIRNLKRGEVGGGGRYPSRKKGLLKKRRPWPMTTFLYRLYATRTVIPMQSCVFRSSTRNAPLAPGSILAISTCPFATVFSKSKTSTLNEL
jgi:hypothetical protein